MNAHPDGASPAPAPATPGGPKPAFERLINAFSFITMAMTVPQAVAVWRSSAEGVSLLSWAAYLVSACLWLVHGLRKRDPTLWMPCVGWIALDAAIVLGVLLRQ